MEVTQLIVFLSSQVNGTGQKTSFPIVRDSILSTVLYTLRAITHYSLLINILLQDFGGPTSTTTTMDIIIGHLMVVWHVLARCLEVAKFD